GAYFTNPDEVASYFESICIMVGIQGQTREMIARDIEILTSKFQYGCINVFQDNTTIIKKDQLLIDWFQENYAYLEQDPRFEVLFQITDFGVGD
ncbi:MAG: radical SAM protein, partial [Oscillospiraceae bacterium]